MAYILQTIQDLYSFRLAGKGGNQPGFTKEREEK